MWLIVCQGWESVERIDRYLEKVDRRGPDECWLWTGKRHGEYGVFWDGEREVRAHRWGFVAIVGPIPPGQIVRHTCDVGACQNPRHWLLGTQQDNVNDMIERGRKRVGSLPGDRNGRACLTWEMVREIRALYAVGGETIYSLEQKYPVGARQIAHILAGRRWKEAS